MAGRDVDGQSFSRLSGFVRYGGDSRTRDEGAMVEDSYSGGPNERGAEVFVDAGVNVNEVHIDLEPTIPQTTTPVGADPHFARGCTPCSVRKERSRSAPGARRGGAIMLIGLRAIDYRHRYNDFVRARRLRRRRSLRSRDSRLLDLLWARRAVAQFPPRWLPKWDLGLDFRYAQNIARDHVLATDPQGPRPESFLQDRKCGVVSFPTFLIDSNAMTRGTSALRKSPPSAESYRIGFFV